MGKFGRELSGSHMDFIRRQAMFFTATAPGGDGRVNLSPKGYDSFAIVDAHTVAYVDFAGSGNETANHLRDNGRITFMWCSFDADPLILRIYGYGKVIEKGTEEYLAWMQRCFPKFKPEAARQVMVCEIEMVQTSCGFAVPLMRLEGERAKLVEWTEGQIAKGTLDAYIEKNAPRLDEKYPVQRPSSM